MGCETLFEGPTFTLEDARFACHERRFITLGVLEGRVVVVAHTESGDLIEIISIRKATRHEQALYFQHTPYSRGPD